MSAVAHIITAVQYAIPVFIHLISISGYTAVNGRLLAAGNL